MLPGDAVCQNYTASPSDLHTILPTRVVNPCVMLVLLRPYVRRSRGLSHPFPSVRGAVAPCWRPAPVGTITPHFPVRDGRYSQTHARFD